MLPINFHQTFIPERRYIAALLQYAALGRAGTIAELAEQTGIPMGKSSGKAAATLRYAEAMGLIEQDNSLRREISPELTPFGRIVYAEDKFMGEEIIQWLAHMNLCSLHTGAEAWWAVFAEGRKILGIRFTAEELEAYLVGLFGSSKTRTRTGPLVGTYLEDAALARSNVLIKEGQTLLRRKAPIINNYRIAYSAYILSLLESHFPGQNQVTVSDFGRNTLWFDICLWNQGDVEQLLSFIEHTGFISVDRQMDPWIIEKRANADQVWPLIYSELA